MPTSYDYVLKQGLRFSLKNFFDEYRSTFIETDEVITHWEGVGSIVADAVSHYLDAALTRLPQYYAMRYPLPSTCPPSVQAIIFPLKEWLRYDCMRLCRGEVTSFYDQVGEEFVTFLWKENGDFILKRGVGSTWLESVLNAISCERMERVRWGLDR